MRRTENRSLDRLIVSKFYQWPIVGGWVDTDGALHLFAEDGEIPVDLDRFSPTTNALQSYILLQDFEDRYEKKLFVSVSEDHVYVSNYDLTTGKLMHGWEGYPRMLFGDDNFCVVVCLAVAKLLMIIDARRIRDERL